jgi:hypothetical protein
MTEPAPVYHTAAPGDDAGRLPTRAVNLARRLLELERLCAGRGQVDVRLTMIDGLWVMTVGKPATIEKLGAG